MASVTVDDAGNILAVNMTEIEGEPTITEELAANILKADFGTYIYANGVVTEDAEKVTLHRVAQLEQELISLDKAVIRGVDDILDVLIAKGLIVYTDLPQELQDKMTQRKEKRTELNTLRGSM